MNVPFKIQVFRSIYRKFVRNDKFSVKYQNNGKIVFKYGIFLQHVGESWSRSSQSLLTEATLKQLKNIKTLHAMGHFYCSKRTTVCAYFIHDVRNH